MFLCPSEVFLFSNFRPGFRKLALAGSWYDPDGPVSWLTPRVR
jgi:hypothetical protein